MQSSEHRDLSFHHDLQNSISCKSEWIINTLGWVILVETRTHRNKCVYIFLHNGGELHLKLEVSDRYFKHFLQFYLKMLWATTWLVITYSLGVQSDLAYLKYFSVSWNIKVGNKVDPLMPGLWAGAIERLLSLNHVITILTSLVESLFK